MSGCHFIDEIKKSIIGTKKRDLLCLWLYILSPWSKRLYPYGTPLGCWPIVTQKYCYTSSPRGPRADIWHRWIAYYEERTFVCFVVLVFGCALASATTNHGKNLTTTTHKVVPYRRHHLHFFQCAVRPFVKKTCRYTIFPLPGHLPRCVGSNRQGNWIPLPTKITRGG